jgi:hypothetical protein
VLKLGSLGEIERLAMTFVHRCSGGTALNGELRIVNGVSR